MKLSGKTKTAICQTVMVLAFLVGMMLNYYMLTPIIFNEKDNVFWTDAHAYLDLFTAERGCDPYNGVQVDSVMAMKRDPYRSGFLIIMDDSFHIVYSQGGETGNGLEMVDDRFGSTAVDLLRRELLHPSEVEDMAYDWISHQEYIADYHPVSKLMYFYTIDYWKGYGDIMGKVLFLLAALTIGGLLMVFLGFYIFKKIDREEHRAHLVNKDLETAALIQRSMLPVGNKQLMQIDVNAVLVPAQTVAGDFFSYLLHDGLLYFCIGDVSGKGIPASLFMSRAVTSFRSLAVGNLSPAQIASRLNSELCRGNVQNMFLTGILGSVRATDGLITFVNAGHEPPVVWDGREGSPIRLLDTEGNVPFGLLDDIGWKEETYEIGAGGMVMLYTDGVSESRNQHSGLLGRDALLGVIDSVKSSSAEQINRHLLEYISGFSAGASQSDDITLLTFRNTASPKSLVLRNKVSDLKKIPEFLQDIFKEFPLPSSQKAMVRAGLDEALTNCVMYAYDGPDGEISFQAAIVNHALVFEIRDSGKPFNPLAYTGGPADELSETGRGISIYKAAFDDVQYVREDGCNVLKLIKNQ